MFRRTYSKVLRKVVLLAAKLLFASPRLAIIRSCSQVRPWKPVLECGAHT